MKPMRERGWVAIVLGGVLGVVAAIGIFLLRNWLCHHAALPLAILGWLITALIVSCCVAIYRTTPKHTQDSPNVSYMATVFVTGIMGMLVGLAVYHWWQGVGGSNRFAYLIMEAVLAGIVSYGFRQATEPLSDFLDRNTDDIDDIEDIEATRAILRAFDWLLKLSSGFDVALMFGLIILELARPFLR